MKRKREMEKESEIRSAIEELSMWDKLKTEDCDSPSVPTNHFLSLCNLVLHVLDKIGPTMAVLRQDVHQNIQKIERVYESGTSVYGNLGEILKKEATEGNLKKVHGCGRAILWLTRSLDFTLALLQKLTKESEPSMEEAVEDSYNVALKPWHGWISSAAFKIALKLVPDNKNFMDLLMAKGENSETLLEELKTFVSLLLPFLERLHSVLILYRLDQLKSP